MSRLLHRLGAFAYRRPWPFVLFWALLVGTALTLAATSNGHISSSMVIDGTPSQEVRDQLKKDLPAAGGGQGTLVFTAPKDERLDSTERSAAIARAAKDVMSLPAVVDRAAAAKKAQETVPATGTMTPPPGTTTPPAGVTAPPGSDQTPQQVPSSSPAPFKPLIVDGAPIPGVMMSPDGSVALIQVQFIDQIDELPEGTIDNLVTTAEKSVSNTGITVLPSSSLDAMHPPIGGTEAIGLAVALVVLFLTLGSLVAAGLPLITAATGVAIGLGSAFALSRTITLTTSTPALALMVGLAVGIDYALFIVNRQRQLIIKDDLSAANATARAVATAGSAVVFAGSTVVIALAGLTVIGIGFLTTMALVAASTVALAVLVALTLLPALLGLVGERICSEKTRKRSRADEATKRVGFAQRWVQGLVRYPWFAIVGVVFVLGVAALPAMDMKLGMPTGANDAAESTSRQSYDAVTRGFGEGFNAPLVIVAHPESGPKLDQKTIGAVSMGLQKTPGVASASLMGADPQQSLAVFTVIPEHGPDDPRTARLVEDLRDPDSALSARTGVDIGVTGLTAINIDITDRLDDALPQYVSIIVGLSLILLLLVFRSVVIPIKATIGFLLTIAATFGVITAVFQWGWLIGIVGLDTGGTLLSFLPIMVTGILYGLAMDYQVFLVSSMREAHVQGMAPRRSIIHGFEHASPVVLAAAIIMVSVFASFMFSEDTMIKQFGFALAIGVVIDAFLIRMTLVPATMQILGRSVWWLPRWLDKILPRINVEGHDNEASPK